MASDITDDDILVCEFIHDNKEDADNVYNQKFYDFYGHKKNMNGKDVLKIISIPSKKADFVPEEYLKNILLTRKDFIYHKEVIKFFDVNMIDDKEVIIVFDNQADKDVLLENLIQMNYKNIYIPFVHLCENNIFPKCTTNELFKTYETKVKKYLEFKDVNGKSIFRIVNDDIYKRNNDKNMFFNGMIGRWYKKYARCIGYNYITNELINFNFLHDISNKERTRKHVDCFLRFVDMLKNGTKSEKRWYECYFKEFLQKYDLRTEKNLLKKCIVDELKKIIYSMKEARDTLYFIEIIEVLKGKNVIYITTDEISCMRCMLYKIGMINYLGNMFRYFGILDKKTNKYCVKSFNPTYRFTNKVKFENLIEYEYIIKYHKNIFGYIMDSKKRPNFMKYNVKNGSGSKLDVYNERIDVVKQYPKTKLNETKILFTDMDKYYDTYDTFINKLSIDIDDMLERLRNNDDKVIFYVKTFKEIFSEIFTFMELSDDDLCKYVNKEEICNIQRCIDGWTVQMETYKEKKNHKEFNEEEIKKYIRLTLYDYVNFGDFRKTMELLNIFFGSEIKERNIDLQLICEIFNIIKSNNKRRSKRLMEMYGDEYEENDEDDDG
jgi:hypothetical protein